MRTALAFLTRLPVGTPPDPDLSRDAPFFPLVGLVVGGIAAGVRAAGDQVLPPLPSTLLAVTAAIIVTGGLHEDGFADMADAVGAHVGRERRLEILKDPRVGVFGALALILAVGLTTTSIAGLGTGDAAKALVAAHVLARWAMLPVSRFVAPAKAGGSGSLLRVGAVGLGLGTVVAAVIAVLLGAWWACAAAVVAVAVAVLVLRRALGGVTGDGYGATAKLAEILVCVTLAAVWA